MPRPCPFTPGGRRRGASCIGGWMGPGAGLDGCRKSRPHPPTGIRSPVRPTRIELLYRLSYLGHRFSVWLLRICYFQLECALFFLADVTAFFYIRYIRKMVASTVFPNHLFKTIWFYLHSRVFQTPSTQLHRLSRSRDLRCWQVLQLSPEQLANTLPPRWVGPLRPKHTVISTFYQHTAFVSHLHTLVNTPKHSLPDWRIAVNFSNSMAIFSVRPGDASKIPS
jgi:hypothetical protein